MDIPLDSAHGLTSLAAGILIALCLHLVMKIVNTTITVVKNIRESDGKKMDHLMKSMDENTKAIYELNQSLKSLNDRIVESDISAAKTDLNVSRLVATVRALAGDRWAEIQKKVRDDEFIEHPKR